MVVVFSVSGKEVLGLFENLTDARDSVQREPVNLQNACDLFIFPRAASSVKGIHHVYSFTIPQCPGCFASNLFHWLSEKN